MHFSKTYTQLLLSLPPELRDNAIQYRQLKKVINQIVNELSSLGLQPAVLHELIEASEADTSPPTSPPQPDQDPATIESSTDDENGYKLSAPRVVYELNNISGRIEPQLRIWTNVPKPVIPLLPPVPKGGDTESPDPPEDGQEEGVSRVDAEDIEQVSSPAISGQTSLLWAFQQLRFGEDSLYRNSLSHSQSTTNGFTDGDTTNTTSADTPRQPDTSSIHSSGSPSSQTGSMQEIVIPLVHDTEFYNMLSTTLHQISAHLETMRSDFVQSLEALSRAIADSSAPASVSASFHPLSSITADAGAVRVKTGELKSDLYSWREIFQLYVEAEVFESVGETTRGERSVEESEKRLQQFAERVTQHGLGDRRKFKSKQSIAALESFLSLNLFILNIKKFSHANSEATRKILKKHDKRTSLFLQHGTTAPTVEGAPRSLLPLLALIPQLSPSFSLPRILVQAVGETLLPVIPSVEDYSCLICTSLAFKPIRLTCGHLFCVRCLVKMQKRKADNCPMCRSRSVLIANRTNVDWALLNFMQDWFPLEAKEKLKSNEKEAAEEELRELGIDPNQTCLTM